MAWIGHAVDGEHAKAQLIEVFNEFHGAYGESVEGIDRNFVTESLFSEKALGLLEGLGGRAAVYACAMLHFNRS